MEDEYMARSEEAEVQNDGGSNNGNGSTASHSSEEFVKVNDEDATLDEGAGDIPREDIEELPVHTETPAEGRLIDKIDPRATETGSMSSESYLRDYYEQLPSETAGFGEGETGDLLGHSQPQSDPTSILQPQSASTYESNSAAEVDGSLASELSLSGGLASFEPTPAASFEPRETYNLSDMNSKPQLQDSDILEDRAFKEEPQPQDCEKSEVDMSSEQEHQQEPAVTEIEGGEPDEPKFQQVVDLIYWRDVKKTAFVFTFLLLILVSLVCYSVISVAAYAGLALLTVTVAFRLYKIVLQTLNGTQQPHPFQDLLDMDVTLSQDRIQKYTNSALCHINCCLTGARNLFLVQNTISSLKLGVFLWLLTYLGACFNGLTLLIIDVILVFTVPIFYEKYQTPIDNYLGIAKSKITELTATVKAKLPGAKKAQKEKAQ
ncbi:reticulon-1-like isoform X8 [Styela clava]